MAAARIGRTPEPHSVRAPGGASTAPPTRGAPIGASVRYRAAFMSAADAFVIVGRDDGRLIDVDDKFLAMHGYRRDEVIGRTSLELGMWAEPAARERLLAELDRTGFVRAFEVLAVRKGGELFRVLYSVTPIHVTGSAPLLLGALRDVSDDYQGREALRQSDAALHASDERLRTLVEDAAVAIGVSRSGITTWVNETYLRMFGFESDAELIGHDLTEQIAPQDRAKMHDRALRRERGEAVENLYEAMFQRRDGSTFPGQCAVSRLTLAEGPVSVAFISDITELRQAEADLELEKTIAGALRDAVHALREVWSAEESATAICQALVELPAISFAAIYAFGPEGRLLPVGHAAPSGTVAPPAAEPSTRLRHVTEELAKGSFAELWEPLEDDGPLSILLTTLGVRAAAFGPIEHGDHIDGVLVIATTDEPFARTLVERIPKVVDFTSTPSALLAERLHLWRNEAERRAAIEEAIAGRAFVPWFQPIVDLRTGDTVGYEALTRFGSGERPDLCFTTAWRVGLGVALELATLDAAVEAARRLPGTPWLDLNVSPGMLLEAVDQLDASLRDVRLPVVLEIAEHAAITDYAHIRDAVRSLACNPRLAVDDAGAGIANFGHIVELRPDFVKIDIGLVRGIDHDSARQALVVAMAHFARETGCQLVAEGIETSAEEETLRALGVEYGQGYLLGRPAPLPG